jgi:hypothetical protein
MEVRKAIVDRGSMPGLLRTVRGRGYRFVGPVREHELAVPHGTSQPPAFPAVERLVQDSALSLEAFGIAHKPDRPYATAPGADEEYKAVTVLCYAVADAPALAARLGPETMYRLMQAMVADAAEVVRRYEGTIVHVTGESFTALFGAPPAQEDHARRAVLAAIEPRQCRFVGRVRELELLHDRLAQATQGQEQVVGIVGEPGMGKSKLLYEFAQRLGGQPVMYCEGHCLAYGSAMPYLLMRALVQQLCSLSDADGPEEIAASVYRHIRQTGMAPEGEAPLLLQLLDVYVDTTVLTQLSPEARKARTFALLHRMILHESRRQPLILAVENLHWIDATSEEWLTTLAERLAGTALLLLATYRPGYCPAWLNKSYATQLALPRLTPDESLMVVQAAAQTTLIPDPLRRGIIVKAAGNPFFLEELTRSVLEEGRHHTAAITPDTIQAVLAARIDRLPPVQKRLLQTAAVIGKDVPFLLLQAIADMPEETLHRGLLHLQAAEFLYETSLVPEHTYTFTHALTHEVAYASLLQRRRRALHTRIVGAIERLQADRLTPQVEQLADHAFRGQVWDKAAAYLQQAGTKAAAHFPGRISSSGGLPRQERGVPSKARR